MFDLKTGALSRLTDTAENEVNPDFSPDGERIAYESGTIDIPVPGVFGQTDIYVVDADGGPPVNLTNSLESFEFSADWRPAGDTKRGGE